MTTRTTLTLDEDVAAKLTAKARRTGRSFKETVNEAIRHGLALSERPAPAKPFRVRARDLNPRPGIDYGNVHELLDQLEGPLHR